MNDEQYPYPKTILTMLACISVISITVVSLRYCYQKKHQSFPFKEVGVVGPSVSTSYLKEEFGDEYEIIMAAAARNSCSGNDLLILFAIRKAENGPPGNEFGIEVQRGSGLDTQAGWAAATIMKNRGRWKAKEGYDELFGNSGFIMFLGERYCLLNSDVWIQNVYHWFYKFKEKENE